MSAFVWPPRQRQHPEGLDPRDALCRAPEGCRVEGLGSLWSLPSGRLVDEDIETCGFTVARRGDPWFYLRCRDHPPPGYERRRDD